MVSGRTPTERQRPSIDTQAEVGNDGATTINPTTTFYMPCTEEFPWPGPPAAHSPLSIGLCLQSGGDCVHDSRNDSEPGDI